MSERRPSSHDADHWRRWQMGELGDPAGEHRQREQARYEAIRQQAFKRNAELEALREKAREEARQEGFRAGYEAGHAEGFEQGQREGRKAGEQEMQHLIQQTLSPLGPLARHFREALEQLDEEVAVQLVELALATGKRLAGEALDAHPEQILEIVRELLHVEPGLGGQPRLWLHPADLSIVQAQIGNEFAAAGWKLQPDDQISRGGCRVTSTSGELDATWERRWESIASQVRRRSHQAESNGDAEQEEDA
ncbi:flagellar assembly protein FliH [Litchfieldella qijiaojingensis]|uniref:Flagellar assembly protein FliH n=1 Tax=Litchfieldella qijiaojingensis TaxID=980347 RepID=A0ABQ2YAK1_9GAMM|nr:flagellar assembly protein FliH [Halomonas qijiaojingensis]GGX78114.1 flagellar assembly protein FliH [Halomonas qijiaojingensis]